MILNRLGNKRRLTSKILPYIPEHDLFIEPFFGAGGFYFHKPKAKYNVVNDSDAEVYNLFQVVRFQAEELAQVFQELPIHQRLWDHWRKNKEEDQVWRAARFLFLSNFGYMGKAQTLRFPSKKTKELILQRMILTAMKLENVDQPSTHLLLLRSALPGHLQQLRIRVHRARQYRLIRLPAVLRSALDDVRI